MWGCNSGCASVGMEGASEGSLGVGSGEAGAWMMFCLRREPGVSGQRVGDYRAVLPPSITLGPLLGSHSVMELTLGRNSFLAGHVLQADAVLSLC